MPVRNGSQGQLSRLARILGYVGLLPQLLAVLLVASGHSVAGVLLATIYSSVIVSFLGGIWWGVAVRRRTHQEALFIVSVLPSLAVAAIDCVAALAHAWPRGLLGLGVLTMLTLPVDRALEQGGDTPVGWFRLRLQLSTSLASLTIVTGLLAS